ncbi:AraC family transcriptional regulator [Pontiella agarivorans]|uniref:AraC family transcriptional regulator n=1 Tax=Pontiella agarivorans TaxID=3038953 RepID=A0ABU5MTN2_9BACT|nr:AraC family transcriptional regulator [Pontiella agarivorans]MDZ8117580.1 AraC family transcriptional regulator [Pontiella agarivorans]
MKTSDQLHIESLRLSLFETGHSRLSREWNYPRVSSPFSRIFLIEEGEAVIRHSGREHQLQAGDLHLVPCYVTADYFCPESHIQYFVGFTLRTETGTDLFSLRSCKPTLKASAHHVHLFQRLIKLLEPHAEAFGRLAHAEVPLAVNIEVRGIVLQLASTFLHNSHKPTLQEQELEGRFAPVLQYIDENLRRDIPLETLADLTGLTPTYFSDLFSRILNVRPVEFINRKRIERAQLMLGSTDLTIQEIAAECGIHSSAYFSRLFSKIAGVSPRSYRKMLRDL